jgi:hypothetical protein
MKPPRSLPPPRPARPPSRMRSPLTRGRAGVECFSLSFRERAGVRGNFFPGGAPRSQKKPAGREGVQTDGHGGADDGFGVMLYLPATSLCDLVMRRALFMYVNLRSSTKNVPRRRRRGAVCLKTGQNLASAKPARGKVPRKRSFPGLPNVGEPEKISSRPP